MQRSFLKTWIIGLWLAVALLLSGCSAWRLAYSQGERLSYWWLDAYVDFDPTQGHAARQALERWFQWHRSTQLPDYAQFFARLQAQAAEPVSAPQVCQVYQEALGRLDPMLEQALPLAVDTVRSLTLEQVAHMEHKYAKVNAEFRDDFLQSDPKKRLDASVERAVDRFEMFYGPLDEAQLDRLRRAIGASPFDAALWLEERQLRQQEVLGTFRRLVRERASPDQTLAALRVLVRHARHSPRPAYLAYQQRLHQYNCQLVAQLHNSASREQRAHVVKTLKAWEADARELRGDARDVALPAPRSP